MGANYYLLDYDSKSAIGGYKRRFLWGESWGENSIPVSGIDPVGGMTHAQVAGLMARTDPGAEYMAIVMAWCADKEGPFYAASDYGSMPWDRWDPMTGERNLDCDEDWVIVDLDRNPRVTLDYIGG